MENSTVAELFLVQELARAIINNRLDYFLRSQQVRELDALDSFLERLAALIDTERQEKRSIPF